MKPGVSPRRLSIVFFSLIGLLVLVAGGCGTVQQETEEFSSTPPSPVSVTARLEYRIDSLMNENRRLRQQMEALATENRSLTARNAELETRLSGGETPTRLRTPAGGTVVPPAPKGTTPSSDTSPSYESALALYRQKNYQEAIDQFQSLLSGGGSEDLSNNCRYWMGESYYALKKYSDAIAQFETVAASKLPAKKSDALLMIGNSQALAGNAMAAKEAYKRTIESFPSSRAAKLAQDKLSRMK